MELLKKLSGEQILGTINQEVEETYKARVANDIAKLTMQLIPQDKHGELMLKGARVTLMNHIVHSFLYDLSKGDNTACDALRKRLMDISPELKDAISVTLDSNG